MGSRESWRRGGLEVTRYAKRVDDNHAELRDGIRTAGFPVLDLSACGNGVPDLSVMVYPGICVFLEVKDGAKNASSRKLTTAEEMWREYAGRYTRTVLSLPDALEAIDQFVRDWGKYGQP